MALLLFYTLFPADAAATAVVTSQPIFSCNSHLRIDISNRKLLETVSFSQLNQLSLYQSSVSAFVGADAPRIDTFCTRYTAATLKLYFVPGSRPVNV